MESCCDRPEGREPVWVYSFFSIRRMCCHGPSHRRYQKPEGDDDDDDDVPDLVETTFEDAAK